MLTDFYNFLFGTRCTELICNIIIVIDYLPHLHSTAAALPWETSQVHNDNFQSYQPKLHITVV